MKNFKELEIKEDIIKTLEKMNITEPMPIQAEGIPKIKANKDVILESATGSGKTLAYLLPLIEKIDFDERKNQFIILVPTHELALQVNHVVSEIGKNSNEEIRTCVIMGDVNIKRQVEMLKNKPQFVIGSPGRILELIKMKKISAHAVKTIVIDECDKLMDDNNIDQAKAVIKTTLRDRQIVMASATVSEEVLKVANDIMKDPEVIKCATTVKVNPNIKHMYIVCDRRDKILMIRKLMAGLKPNKAIAFINRSEEVEELTSKLAYHSLKVGSIHGTFVKNERQKAMQDFKSGKVNLLVSSDLSARGLDIEGVTHIFNIDLPEDVNTYVHRCGRTARANNSGTVITIVAPNEIQHIRNFAYKLGVTLTEKTLSYGELCDVKTVVKDTPVKKTAEAPKKNSKARRDKYGEDFRANKKEIRERSFSDNNNSYSAKKTEFKSEKPRTSSEGKRFTSDSRSKKPYGSFKKKSK